ncbi:hypothetical protein C2G38_2204555 [Gigaspora rosea]|uniref:Uncharacterized protein n=1 Tax=Gigaspora rosea TaxID=44941 RepID=A0A397UPB2_9GLOM|nr:hypothetical protein C2G38_2204555 [Gigaspora rosea]
MECDVECDVEYDVEYELVLPTAWDIEDKSPFIDIDSSGLKVSYTVKVTIRTKRNHVIFAIADIQEIPILSIIHKSIDESFFPKGPITPLTANKSRL